MTKKLTEDQFEQAIKKLNISQKTKEIAYGVLVLSEKQSLYVKKFNLSKGAISQAVDRVYKKADITPAGFETVTVTLPKYRAFLVKKWDLKRDK